MTSQRDPQNLKDLTKSEKWKLQMAFESFFARFRFRQGFQVAPKDLENLKKYSSTSVKSMFPEIHSSHKVVSFWYILGAFWHHFPSHGLPNDAQSGKKDPFKKLQKNDQILEA